MTHTRGRLSIWRFIVRSGAAVIAALTLVSCGAGVHSPSQQRDRERKAAGVSTFRIVCSRDLWNRTGMEKTDGINGSPVPAKITQRPDGLVTVELTGPNLVDLLEYLDAHAHPGWWDGVDLDPLALRMYNAIAPRVDAIQPTPMAGEPVPEVVINDSVKTSEPPRTTAPSTSPKTSPTR